ncbi:hypothetical protein ACIU1J_10085 [Azospirillum doebereinerae]|uniref:hypothetical protein n=1 Tax=Azospirillum doebereinerae TaxID=92933 RepID=UPI001EE508D7|nr:hypothetical protein [Azospirillum doebereinerae]MCG5244109.1 hypothetical protein [Azospirillum doebereinerae]
MRLNSREVSVRGEISRIIDALSLIEECRDNYPYRRTSDGGFEPPQFMLPTWVWHELVGAMEECCKMTGSGFKDECDNQGNISQDIRAFRGVARCSDDPKYAYSHDGKQFHPSEITVDTSIWHEIVLRSHEQTAEWERLEAYRPPTLED